MESLNAGTLPEEIKNEIYDFGFVKGPPARVARMRIYPTLEEGNL